MKHQLIALAATALAITGCAQRPTQVTAPAAISNEGIAKTCTPSAVDFVNAASTATITMTNDGWCALDTKDKNGEPFKYGLVKTKAQHGFIFIQKVGGETRIEYTADNRYVGADRFSVALASAMPNTPDSTIQVTVDVTRGEGVPPPAPATPAPTSSSSTKRRTTTRH